MSTGFDDEGAFYAEEYLWEKDRRKGYGHPPMFYPSKAGDPTETEQAANVAAATLHAATESIGAIPIISEREGDLLDVDLAESLARLSGLQPSALRAGLMLLRSDGYRLIKAWWMRDDENGWEEGRQELWPNPDPDPGDEE